MELVKVDSFTLHRYDDMLSVMESGRKLGYVFDMQTEVEDVSDYFTKPELFYRIDFLKVVE